MRTLGIIITQDTLNDITHYKVHLWRLFFALLAPYWPKMFPYLLKFEENTGQDAKKVTFTVCHSGKLQLAYTSPRDILISLKKIIVISRIDYSFSVI